MTHQGDSAIKSILLTFWDPIGISFEPKAQDEYDAYIAPLHKLIASHAGLTQFVAFLTQAEMSMGLVPDVARAEKVAKKLLLTAI